FRANHKGKMVKDFFVAVLLTILLNINTLIGFAEVYLTNELVYPKFFEDVLSYTIYFDIGDNTYSSLGLIFSCIMLFQIFYLFINWKSTSILERLLTLVGAFFLLLSSNFLPWEDISQHTNLVRIIQFPRRFSLVAYVFLLISFAFTLENNVKGLSKANKKIVYPILCMISFFMIANVNSKVLQSAEAWETDNPTAAGNNADWATTDDPDELRKGFTSGRYEDAFKVIQKPTPDYLPLLNDTTQEELEEQGGYNLYGDQVINNELNVSKTTDNRNRLVLTWESNGNEKEVLPAVVYECSQINFNGNNFTSSQIAKTDLGAPIVETKNGTNKFVVSYEPLVNTTLLLVIKFFTIGFLVIFVFVKGLRKFFEDRNQNSE
ncbi:MAG: hypothetical protein L0L86_08345, partial [Lactococcus lactis]|nr:hypothetical protein [Lactococcus lactis]